MKSSHIIKNVVKLLINKLLYLFISGFIVLSFIRSTAQVYEFNALHGTGDYYKFIQYKIYIPDTIKVLKGVYCFLVWEGALNEESLKKVCNETGFALMISNFLYGTDIYQDQRFGVNKSLIRALYYFAQQSGHPELKYAPLFLEGVSFGVWSVYSFVWWRPETCIGFIAQKFTLDVFNAGPAKKVPGYIFYDLSRDEFIPTPAFELNRSKGAIWCLAREINGDHNTVRDRNLIYNYFKDILKLRLPVNVNPNEPVVLNTIDQTTGWLGDRLTNNIAPYDSFPGNKLIASWLPNEHRAKDWQKFVSDNINNKLIQNDTSFNTPQIFEGLKKKTGTETKSILRNSISLKEANASFIGEKAGDNSGYSIASAGDINGDGYSDFLIGTPGKDGTGLSKTNLGATYLFLGNPEVDWGYNFILSNADASFIGESGSSFSGCSVSSAGDINGDGLDDFIIGARANRYNGINAGKIYLILGRANADWGREFNLAQADASFIGEASNDWSGAHVSSAGDINGDGLDDFLIGAEGNDLDSLNFDTGKVYLVLGRSNANWGQNYNLLKTDASFSGEFSLDGAGFSVSSAGDVNGDGLSDILIGTKLNFANDAYDDSKTYLLLGKRDLDWGHNYNLSRADASFIGEKRLDRSGFSIASAGDVNGDGLADFIIGAHDNSGNDFFSGKAYLILGRSKADWGLNFKLSKADASFIGENAFDAASFSVSLAGDINGDNLSDFIVGAPNNSAGNEFSGKIYLILGRNAADWGMDFKLSEAEFAFTGEASQDLAGFFVASAGDINNDGLGDVLINAQQIGKEEGAGKTYLILGGGLTSKINDDLVRPESMLFQNFPNPFNPLTIIQYKTADNALVKLKLYNTLGKEVAVLVDEHKPAGSYEVKLNAVNLSSGVYLYTLQAGNYFETRKLTLLK